MIDIKINIIRYTSRLGFILIFYRLTTFIADGCILRKISNKKWFGEGFAIVGKRQGQNFDGQCQKKTLDFTITLLYSLQAHIYHTDLILYWTYGFEV